MTDGDATCQSMLVISDDGKDLDDELAKCAGAQRGPEESDAAAAVRKSRLGL